MQPLNSVVFFFCVGLAVIGGEPQFPLYAAGYPYFGVFHAGGQQGQGRFFFNTKTIVISTSTTTFTTTSTTTCTTSTAALSACVAGRRRRALESGLYYEDDAADSVFLPAPAKPEEIVAEKGIEPVRSSREVVVPIMLEPGFAASNGIAPRFLLAFSTSTVTKTTTATTTSSLTAICSSPTTFSVCGSSGK